MERTEKDEGHWLDRSPRKTRTKRWSFDIQDPTRESLASSKMSRRKLSDFSSADSVHKEVNTFDISPAQLYSTESGRLFHAGKICVVLCGPPGQGKTHLSVSLTRYLRWLGVKTHVFHLGDYRRAHAMDYVDHGIFVPERFNTKYKTFRKKITFEIVNDIENFFLNDKGQIAIYDAVNALPEDRLDLYNKFSDMNVLTLFIELAVNNYDIIMKNMEEAALSSPDYRNWNFEDAYADYHARIKALIPFYQYMSDPIEEHLPVIKFINFGEKIELHRTSQGYLINKIVFFLMNSKIKLGSLFFARCYNNSIDYTSDPPLDEEGKRYATNLSKTLKDYFHSQGKHYYGSKDNDGNDISQDTKRQFSNSEGSPSNEGKNEFVIWTTLKRRTLELTKYLENENIDIYQRVQLSQKNPGVFGGMSEDELAEKHPDHHKNYIRDPYHYRLPRAELYHDLAIKIESLILEMERLSGDLLIIADESVIKVFYGYLMACSCYDIPSLSFPSNEIIEIKFNAYQNTSKRIPIQNYA